MRSLRHMVRLAWLVPVVCSVLFSLIHIWWLGQDTVALYWDQARHGSNALTLLDIVTLPGVPLWDRCRMLYQGPDGYYPPFFYWVSLPFTWLLGRSADAVALANLPFLLVLNVSVFSMARKLGGLRHAWLAPLLASCAPMLWDFAHQVMLDFALTAMTAAVLALLVHRPFSSWRKALLLGVVIGCGFLTKWTSPAFIALPVAWAFFSNVKNRRDLLRQAGAGVFAVLGALLVAREWTASHQAGLLKTGESTSHVPSLHAVFSSGLLEFMGHVPRFQLDGVGTLLALAALAAVTTSTLKWRAMPLVLCVLSSVGAWGVLGQHQDPRYSLPQLAAVVPLMALLPRVFRRHSVAFTGVLAGWCVLVLVNLCVAPGVLNFESWGAVRLLAQRGYHQGPPGNSPSEQPLKGLMEHIAQDGRPTTVAFESDVNVQGLDAFAAGFYARSAGLAPVDQGAQWLVRFTANPLQATHQEVQAVPSGRDEHPFVQLASRVDVQQALPWVRVECGAGWWLVTSVDNTAWLRVMRRGQPRDSGQVGVLGVLVHLEEGETLLWSGPGDAVKTSRVTDGLEGSPSLRLPFHVVSGTQDPPRLQGPGSPLWLAGPFMVLPPGNVEVLLETTSDGPPLAENALELQLHGPRRPPSRLERSATATSQTTTLHASVARPERDVEFWVLTHDLAESNTLTAQRMELVFPDVHALEQTLALNGARFGWAAIYPLHAAVTAP